MANGDTGIDEFFQSLSLEENRETAELLLQKEPKETINNARKGDFQALTTLSSCPDVLPVHLVLDACNVFCAPLRQGVPSLGAYQGISKQERLALVSVIGLAGLLNNFSSPELEKTVQNSWRAIAKWLLLFQEKYLRKKSQEYHILGVSIVMLLYSVFSYKIKGQICSDQQMLRLIAHLWSDNDVDSSGYASRCFVVYSGYSSQLKTTLRSLVLAENHGVPDVAALKIQERIRLASYDFFEDARLLDAFASAIVAFCSESGEMSNYIQTAIALNEGIYDFTELLDRRLVRSIPPSDSYNYEPACSATSKIFTFIFRILDTAHGSAWIEPALQSGLLRALINFCPHLGEEPLRKSFRNAISDVLSVTLPHFLMNYATISVAVRSMEKACTSDAREQIMFSPVSQEWDHFERFLLERAVYKALFDRNEDMEVPPMQCGNSDCGKIDTNNNFKKCAACKSIRYCSRECQIVGWKHRNHKVECKGKKDITPEARKEKDFLFYCVRRDVIRHLPGIRKLAERQLPNIPFNVIGVDINYATLPPKFDVFSLEIFLEELMIHRETILINRVLNVLKYARNGRTDMVFTKVLQGKIHTMTAYTEISIASADAFIVREGDRPSREVESRRLVGQSIKLNPLEAVDFDRVDSFIQELQLPSATALASEAEDPVTHLWTRLGEVLDAGETDVSH
ncbi:hypothetical protein EW145_g137 [Phellinidium pouzarii]|uniref:MYND-type domain-containing protein n=1 Tax=Phellinidium pouzarii TaxID=167371 RepID=A0A4S4LK48_9AGAM|nr:hypothetical protein EW145_g137 [Phellinidium pouzarii]